ncbi:hypothetical protein Tco_0563566 [Tanacetum coccineum]
MDNPLVSVEVLRYDIKKSLCENKRMVQTEMELELEQTQQSSSHEVSNIRVIPKYHSEDGNPARANIKQALGRKVYSGKQTQFWIDGWIKDRVPLKSLFPCLYALETKKGYYVSERWVIEDGVWQGKWAWRSQPRGRAEGDLSLLLSLINMIVLDSTQDDKWIWTLNYSGMFLVSSLCRVIQKQMFVNNDVIQLSYGILGSLARQYGFLDKQGGGQIISRGVHDFYVDHMELEKQNPSCELGGESDNDSSLRYFCFGSKDVSPMGFSPGL